MKHRVPHVQLLTMGISMWTLFLIAGLSSDYFLDLSWPAQLLLIVILPTIILVAITFRRIAAMKADAAISRIFWTAFYFTVPFFVLDVAYLGLHQGRGASFLVSHWYLTAFYITPWITLPLLSCRTRMPL